ncbi:hypothetical protein H7J77_01155 [Mycolicibacillus parakoreensis]|uniref:Uncharacterized protein n=1 Tax=Mycolicibacillus parakoreensis TaxID=1069221 RepID=A0ABY3TYT4_9MYCO|nr:hypothetical protein [Mycolicibacillus parakoreensis]MCV7314157.1 hypothetical protein [Mycolicibacillus parakoreensis]ULN52878.1 hypothetical protein MIU77_00310 [Mycolicibacillus parakoreensis]
MADFDPADIARTARELRSTLEAIDRGDANLENVRPKLEAAVLQLESFTSGNP